MGSCLKQSWHLSYGPKQRPRMYLSCFAFINQPERLQNFHLGVGRTCEGEWWVVIWLLSKPPAARLQHRKPALQRTALLTSDQRRKSRGKNPDKSFTPLSAVFLFLKKVIIYPMAWWQYIMSSVSLQDSPLVPQSSDLWLVCISPTNEKIYCFEYDSLPLSRRCRTVTDSEFWGLGGWLSFCCSSQWEKKQQKTKKTVKKWRRSFGFSTRWRLLLLANTY